MFDRLRYEEDMDYEFNARYDYLSEAYGPTARDAAEFARTEWEAERREAMERGEMIQIELALDVYSIADDEIPF